MEYFNVWSKDGKLYGNLVGCGCCGGEVEIKKSDLEEFVADLKKELANAERVLQELEASHVG